jgi:ADP-heptose:LPS heptosyltransferase
MKIAVFRALQLGDLLCAIPAVRAVRAAYPQARIALVGLPWARELAMRFSRYFDGFLEFPGFPGMPERAPQASAVPRFLDAANEEHFDLVLQMHGSGELTNPLAVLMGGALAAGFYRPGHYRPDPQRFFEWHDDEHEVLRWLRLVRALGMEPRGEQLEFPLREQDWADWRSLGLGDYAVLHPGSQLPSRRWPAERFAEVGDELAAEGLQIVLTGSARESTLTKRVRQAMREPAIDLAGETTLGALAAVIARARLLVSNDTGVSHIAAALRTPSVIVACGSDPKRWAPLDAELHRVLYHPIACRPCAYAECPIGHPCALAISSRQVVEEARRAVTCAA